MSISFDDPPPSGHAGLRRLSRRLRVLQDRNNAWSFVAGVKVAAAVASLAGLLLGLEHHRSGQLQRQRTQEQRSLLDTMARQNIPSVTQVVADWQLMYPEPSEERLAELRDLALQVRRNPVSLNAPLQKAK